MHFVFRADATPLIGSGHISRCRRLAAALLGEGHRTTFICRAPSKTLRASLKAEGHAVIPLPLDAEASEAADAEATIVALRNTRPDCLVLDHYALGLPWERACRDSAQTIMVIDDLGRDHDCDVLLDQGVLDASVAYAHLPSQTEKLLGPRYALLDPAFRERRGSARRNPDIQRVLVFFGGADGAGQTLQVLRAIDTDNFAHLEFAVVVGAMNADRPDIGAIAARRANIAVLEPMASLAALMSEADLFVGAGGTTTWERCCVGLPALVCWTAENQRPQTEALAALGIHMSLGAAAGLTPERWREELGRALQMPGELRQGADRGMALVDGCGTVRVTAALTGSDTLWLRDAVPQDEALLLAWANDPEMRKNAFSKATISAEQHHAWLSRKLASSATCLWIAETATGRPVGQIRFDCEDEKATLDISIDPQYRGRGYGAKLLASAITKFRASHPRERLEAYVLEGNSASRKLFIAAGFVCDTGCPDERGSYCYVMKGLVGE